MTTDSLYELQKTIIGALKADSTLAPLVNGIFSSAPADAKYPFISVENIAAQDSSSKTGKGFNVNIDIKTFSRTRESREALDILAQVRRILDGASLTPSGCTVSYIREYSSNIARMKDGATWEANIGFIVILQEGSGFVASGNDFIIKIGDGDTPVEGFAIIGGLRNADITLNNRLIDCSNLASGRWRRLVSSAGIASLSVKGDGFFADSAAEELLRGLAFSGNANNYEILVGNNKKVIGTFIVSSYKRSGNMDEAEGFIIGLENSGEVGFVEG